MLSQKKFSSLCIPGNLFFISDAQMRSLKKDLKASRSSAYAETKHENSMEIFLNVMHIFWVQIFTCKYSIMKTSPCTEHPLTPYSYIYIVKLGFTGVYFFYFLLLNIDYGYSLEPHQ